MSHLKDIKIPEHSPRKVGVVLSDNRDKTCKVAIGFMIKHRKYGKYIRRRTLLQVHDAKNESRVGDRVEIAECRPISKTKSWILTKIIRAAVQD